MKGDSIMNWLQRFMIGRYGVMDELSKLLFGLSIGSTLLSMFTGSIIIRSISLVLPLIFFYRTFSKNIRKRYGENIRFLRFWNPIKNKVKNRINRIRGLREYKYYNCENCGQKLRVPRGKGKVSIKCPKCHVRMIKKT